MPTSTTRSSTGWPSRTTDPAVRTALVACGALAQPCAEIVARRGWPLDVHPLPPLLHNQPRRIPAEVERLVGRLRTRYDRVAVGYADCGTYGALDRLCERLAVQRLPGLHCYDLYAGPDRMRAMFDADPGSYVLTDFLVRSFTRTVIQELGLDRHPELRDAYFGHYRQVVWLAQEAGDPELGRLAAEAADRIGLPLTVLPTGVSGLERELAALVGQAGERTADR